MTPRNGGVNGGTTLRPVKEKAKGPALWAVAGFVRGLEEKMGGLGGQMADLSARIERLEGKVDRLCDTLLPKGRGKR